jgi:hypothetical protein
VPFSALQGEGVEYLGRADDTIIAISNYRLHIKFKDSIINVRHNEHMRILRYAGIDPRIGLGFYFTFYIGI